MENKLTSEIEELGDNHLKEETVKPKTKSWKWIMAIVLIVVIIIPVFFFYINLGSIQELHPGITQGSLINLEQDTYRLNLEEASKIHIAVQFDWTNDFDLYLLNENDTIISQSTQWFTIGEQITFKDDPLPMGIYKIIVKSFRGSGDYTLFAAWPLKTMDSEIHWSPALYPHLMNSSLIGVHDFWAIYIPSGLNTEFKLNSTNNTNLDLTVYDGLGRKFGESKTNQYPEIITIAAEALYSLNGWMPTNWFILEVSSQEATMDTYSLSINLQNRSMLFNGLESNATPLGTSFSYRFFYNYTVEVPNGVYVQKLHDAIPLLVSRPPYLNSSLLRVYDLDSGENVTNYSIVTGKDGEPWIRIGLDNLTAGRHSIVFLYEITDYRYDWNRFNTSLTLDDIPEAMKDLWTRSEGSPGLLEIPANLTYFKELAAEVSSLPQYLGYKINAIYFHTLSLFSYSDQYTPVLETRDRTNVSGNCHSYATYMVTLLRALGVPAREAAGISVQSNYQTAYHGWVEVYLPEYGWIPVDPTWADGGGSTPNWYESFRITGSHIRLTTLLQPNGTVWWTYGDQIGTLGSPYPEGLFQIDYQGSVMPVIARGIDNWASP